MIKKAAIDAIANGTDFVKTSTGKTQFGATLEAAEVILNTIKDCGKKVGLKASGGIRIYAQAVEYIELADKIFQAVDFTDYRSFRFGVSGLLDNLLNTTKEQKDGY